MSEKPFPANGDDNGDGTEPFSASPAAPIAPGVASGHEDAQAATDAINPQGGLPAGEPVCEKCGRHHPGGRFLLGCPGPRLRTGLHATNLPPVPDLNTSRMGDLMLRHVGRLSAALDRQQTLHLSDVVHVEKLGALIEKWKSIQAREQVAEAPVDDATAASPDDAAAVRKLARIFSGEPDLFSEFVVALLEADRDRCGPLRSQLRITLEQFEPGLPRPLFDDEPDEIIL